MKQTPVKVDEKVLKGDLLDDVPNSMAIASDLIESIVVKMLDIAWEKDILKRHLKHYNVNFV
jgi:hypothetical protein